MTTDTAQDDTAYAMILDEGYARPFATPLLTGQDWLFTGGRAGFSLAGDWVFTTDLHDSGLRQHWHAMQPMPPEARALPCGRFAHARELGCNYLRLAHYPHHEAAAKLADEMGLMLWEEVPVYWSIAFGNPDTLADARNQLTELIRRDRNRASVIIWSMGNENPDSDARFAFMSTLVQTARALDPTRLVSAACLVNHVRFRIEDRLAEVIDMIGINEYFGWYFPDYEELIAIGRNSDPDRPVIITETGADGVKEGGPATGFFSEDYMTEVYRGRIDILGRLDYIRGMSPWILYDFRAEKRMNRYQRGWNRKGLIAQDKTTRKDAFAVLAAHYHRLAGRDGA